MMKVIFVANFLVASSVLATTTTCQTDSLSRGLSCESNSLISTSGGLSAQSQNFADIPSTDLSLPADSSATGTGVVGVVVNSCMASSLTGCLNGPVVAPTDPGTSKGVNGPGIIKGDPDAAPEPLTFVLLGTGLLGITLICRRSMVRRIAALPSPTR